MTFRSFSLYPKIRYVIFDLKYMSDNLLGISTELLTGCCASTPMWRQPPTINNSNSQIRLFPLWLTLLLAMLLTLWLAP